MNGRGVGTGRRSTAFSYRLRPTRWSVSRDVSPLAAIPFRRWTSGGGSIGGCGCLRPSSNPCRTGGIIGSTTIEDYDLSTLTRGEADDQELETLLEAARRATWDALHGPRFIRSGRFLLFPEDSQVHSASAAGTSAAAQQGDAPDGASRRG